MTADVSKVAGTGENVSGAILATRKAFGTNATPSEDDVVNVGTATGPVWMTIRNAVEAGYLFRKGGGTYGEYDRPGTPTRVDA